jgi:hypothetical protein
MNYDHQKNLEAARAREDRRTDRRMTLVGMAVLLGLAGVFFLAAALGDRPADCLLIGCLYVLLAAAIGGSGR